MRRRYEKGQLVWVAPGAVRYDAVDTDFLLPWLLIMREGSYPVEPSGGYVEGKRTGVSSHAFYETACQVAAEIDIRLAMCFPDNYLVIDSYCRGLEDEQIARDNHLDVREVRRRLKSAVSYIAAGPCPRWIDCIGCPDYQKCSAKKHPPRKFLKQPVGISYQNWKGHRRVKLSHLPTTT
jgi:hypothetical protein